MAGTERQREIRRRRQRREKVRYLSKRAEKATGGDRPEIARKLRKLTPGADIIIQRLGL